MFGVLEAFTGPILAPYLIHLQLIFRAFTAAEAALDRVKAKRSWEVTEPEEERKNPDGPEPLGRDPVRLSRYRKHASLGLLARPD